MSAAWMPAHEAPQIAEGKQLLLRMRGCKLDSSSVVEIDGFYLNAYGLYYDYGCECFETDEERLASGHDDNGCPVSGFYYVDTNGDEAPYLPFRVLEWCRP